MPQATQPDDDLPDMTKTRRGLLAKAVADDITFMRSVADMAEHIKSAALDYHECLTGGRPLSADMSCPLSWPTRCPCDQVVELSFCFRQEKGFSDTAVCLFKHIAALRWQPEQLHVPPQAVHHVMRFAQTAIHID